MAHPLPKNAERHLEQTKAKPFVKWAGGKRQLLPELLARVPRRFNRYFEPFVGGGALFFALGPQSAYLSDINAELVNTYHVLQDDVGSLVKSLKIHYYDEAYFYEVREADRLPSFARWGAVRRASRFIFLNKTCFNGLYRVNSKGQFNTPFGEYKNPRIVDEANLLACSKALQGATVSLDPFDSVLKKAKRGDFVYFDPPYAPLSPTSNFTGYSMDGFDDSMQARLRDVCVELDKKGAFFMASNSSAKLILELYKGFQIDFVEATRAINSKAQLRGNVREVIVTNYKT